MLKEAGIELHAITAESGGEAEVLGRLAKRNVAGLPFPIHSDPEHRLLAPGGGSFYVIEEQDAEANFGADYKGVKYNMVQPAFLVLDREGSVVQRWSWRTIEPTPDPMHWSTKVKVAEGEEGVLVRARPKTTDLLASIQENRLPALGICSMASK